MNVIEAAGLGKRYGSTWALRECSLAIPDGHVVALVGPNGAGKTTLLNLAVGLTAPSAGTVTVLGGTPAGSPVARDGIAFVAQDAPLHKNLSVADMLHLTRNLNLRFDQGYATARLGELAIPLDRKAGKLSGGQQAQLALTLALSRRPQLLPRRSQRRIRSAIKPRRPPEYFPTSNRRRRFLPRLSKLPRLRPRHLKRTIRLNRASNRRLNRIPSRSPRLPRCLSRTPHTNPIFPPMK